MTTAIWPAMNGGGSTIITPSGPAFDAFGRLRISAPQTVFDSKLVYDDQPLYWAEAQTWAAATRGYCDLDTAGTATGTVTTFYT
jgi:hypothetical protein